MRSSRFSIAVVFKAALLASVAAITLPEPVRAAEQVAAINAIEEITVTARRRDELIQSVPIAITAFTQDDLEERGVEVIEDLRYVAPSVYIQTDVFQQNTVNVTIRGQRNFAGNGVGNGVQFDPAAAVYLNGIYFARTLIIVGLLLAPKTEWTIYAFAIAMGFLWLATVPLTSGIVAQVFGVKYMATLFGVVFLSHQLGSFAGVWLGGWLYDTTGSYDIVWWIGVGLGLFAALIHLPIDEKPLARLRPAG